MWLDCPIRGQNIKDMKKREEPKVEIIYTRATNRNKNKIRELATTRMTEQGRRYYQDLPKVLREVAETGKPAEFQFNHYRIRHLIRDEIGNLRLSWIVADGITHKVAEFFNKDYVSDKGNILWKKMAMDMRKV